MDWNKITYQGHEHIGQQIFKSVDVWTLIKGRRVSQSWKIFIDNEMLGYISSQLIGKCSDRMNEPIRVEYTKILQDILQGKNKEDTKHFFEFLKKYWLLIKIKDYIPLHLD